MPSTGANCDSANPYFIQSSVVSMPSTGANCDQQRPRTGRRFPVSMPSTGANCDLIFRLLSANLYGFNALNGRELRRYRVQLDLWETERFNALNGRELRRQIIIEDGYTVKFQCPQRARIATAGCFCLVNTPFVTTYMRNNFLSLFSKQKNKLIASFTDKRRWCEHASIFMGGNRSHLHTLLLPGSILS